MKNNKILLGSHVGFKSPEYLLGSVKETIEYEGNCFMVFTGPPQNFKRKDIDLSLVKKAHDLMNKNNIETKTIVVHAPYLINLASPKESTRQLGLNQLISEIKRTELIDSHLLVLHPGSATGLDRDIAIDNVILGLNEAIEKTPNSKVIICVETMAGKGTEVGITFAEIARMVLGVKDKTRIGVCMDTCHMHEAGIELSNVDKVLDDFEKCLSLDYVKVIHLNDSKNEIGARKDRHENIGYGKIGFDVLVNWAFNSRLENVPKILETPYRDNKPIYKQEIRDINNKKRD